MYQKIITAVLMIGLLVWNPYPLQILELKTFDYLIMNTEVVQNENILIVDIDEETVKTYEGWPLPRSVYGDAIMQTQAIPGITVLMPNKDLRGPLQDEYFTRRLDVKPTVLASAASTQVTGINPHVGTAQLGEDPTPWLYEYPGILPTESTLASKTKGLGLVTATPEIDGVTRRIPLVVNVESKLYPSFALELLRVAVGDPSYQLKTTEEGVTWVRVPNYPLMNTDANGRIFLNWNTNFYRQSLLEYLQQPIEAPFVIIGTTAEGVTNPVPTPAGAKYPHEIQANILHNLINGTAPSAPTWTFLAQLTYGVLALTFLALSVSRVYLSVFALALVIG